MQALYEDAEGVLWVGTCQRGLHRFNRETETFTRVLLGEDASSRTDPSPGVAGGCPMVRVIHEDRAGAFWIGTYDGGLAQLDRATGTVVHYTPLYFKKIGPT